MMIRTGLRTHRLVAGLAAAFVVCVALVSGQAVAESFPDRGQILDMLHAGDFAKLDRRIAAYQVAFENGRQSDRAVEYALKTFANSDPSLLAKIDAWAAKEPDFYAPLAARGIYNWHLGMMAAAGQPDVAKTFFAEAELDLEAALALEPNLSTAYAVLINIEIMRGSPEKVADHLRRGLKQRPASFVIREHYLDSLVPWLNPGKTPSQAMARIDEFVDDIGVSAKREKSLRPLTGYVDFVQSEIARQAGDLDRATAAIERAIRIDGYWKYEVQKGRTLLDMGRCVPARTAFDSALTDRPDVGFVHDYVARTHLCTGGRQQALDSWAMALKFDALHAPSLMGTALLLREMGKFAEARAVLDEAAIFGSADPDIRAMRGALLVNDLHQPSAAIEDLRIATDQRPDRLSYWLDYGNALVQTNRCDAVAALATYLDLCRGNPICSLEDLEWAAGSIEDMSRADCQS
jgi:tetratricopeptide (TPR) repeat protein